MQQEAPEDIDKLKSNFCPDNNGIVVDMLKPGKGIDRFIGLSLQQ